MPNNTRNPINLEFERAFLTLIGIGSILVGGLFFANKISKKNLESRVVGAQYVKEEQVVSVPYSPILDEKIQVKNEAHNIKKVVIYRGIEPTTYDIDGTSVVESSKTDELLSPNHAIITRGADKSDIYNATYPDSKFDYLEVPIKAKPDVVRDTTTKTFSDDLKFNFGDDPNIKTPKDVALNNDKKYSAGEPNHDSARTQLESRLERYGMSSSLRNSDVYIFGEMTGKKIGAVYDDKSQRYREVIIDSEGNKKFGKYIKTSIGQQIERDYRAKNELKIESVDKNLHLGLNDHSQISKNIYHVPDIYRNNGNNGKYGINLGPSKRSARNILNMIEKPSLSMEKEDNSYNPGFMANLKDLGREMYEFMRAPLLLAMPIRKNQTFH